MRVTGAVEAGEVVGVEGIIGVEAGVGVIVVVTLTLPGITHTITVTIHTIPVTTAVTDTILTVPLRTIMDPIQTTMGQTQRIHQLSIS